MTSEHPAAAFSEEAADRLIAAHDGDIALLYLYLLRNPSASRDEAARDLCRTMNEINTAEEKLRRLLPGTGLPSEAPAPASSAPFSGTSSPSQPKVEYSPPEEIPQYTIEEITRRGNSDPVFQSLITEAKRITGGFLSESFTRTLFGIYDYLALPPEVIMMLLNYCGEIAASRPSRRKLSSIDLQKEAFRWYNNGAVTYEAAEDYLSRERSRRSIKGRLKAVFNIVGREFTPSEDRYVEDWLQMGFAEDALAIAYDRTVTNTGSLKWNYMNKILSSWHTNHLHTAEEIRAGDGPHRPSSSGKPSSFDDQELISLLDKLQEAGNGI